MLNIDIYFNGIICSIVFSLTIFSGYIRLVILIRLVPIHPGLFQINS